MRDHQKYFAVEDAKRQTASAFSGGAEYRWRSHRASSATATSACCEPDSTTRASSGRPIRKHPLRERAEWLKNVTFQKDLGSYYDKTLRVQRLCSWLCEIIRQNGMPVRPGVVHKAALLAKTDLTTELVKEFTELQGIVGGLYACVQELDRWHAGCDSASHRRRHLRSVQAGVDGRLRSAHGRRARCSRSATKPTASRECLRLGLQPTGSKDPFALRRQANGIVKIIAEHKLPLGLSQLFADAREAYRGIVGGDRNSRRRSIMRPRSRDFFRERLEFYLRDVLGFKYDVVNAVLAAGSDDVVDAVARAAAVTKVAIVAGLRVDLAWRSSASRIFCARHREPESTVAPMPSMRRYFEEAAERELAARDSASAAASVRGVACARRLRAGASGDLQTAPRRGQVFRQSNGHGRDERIRANRLALLQTLLNEFSTIADFSEIVTEGKESKESSETEKDSSWRHSTLPETEIAT